MEEDSVPLVAEVDESDEQVRVGRPIKGCRVVAGVLDGESPAGR